MIGRLFLVLFLGVLLVAAVAGCGESTYDPAFKPAPIEKRTGQAVIVRWLLVDDVPAECTKRGSSDAGSGRAIAACAHKAADGSTCTIITGHEVTYAHLGHELRHCFEPTWAGHL